MSRGSTACIEHAVSLRALPAPPIDCLPFCPRVGGSELRIRNSRHGHGKPKACELLKPDHFQDIFCELNSPGDSLQTCSWCESSPAPTWHPQQQRTLTHYGSSPSVHRARSVYSASHHHVRTVFMRCHVYQPTTRLVFGQGRLQQHLQV